MSGLNFAILVKGAEHYCFVWDDANRAEVLRTAGRFAENPELSFTWGDCMIVTARVQTLAMQALLETR